MVNYTIKNLIRKRIVSLYRKETILCLDYPIIISKILLAPSNLHVIFTSTTSTMFWCASHFCFCSVKGISTMFPSNYADTYPPPCFLFKSDKLKRIFVLRSFSKGGEGISDYFYCNGEYIRASNSEIKC